MLSESRNQEYRIEMLLLLEKLQLDARLVILFTFLVIVSVFVFTDNLYSSFHNSTFNPSESILRSIFWCLMIPILYVVEHKKTHAPFFAIAASLFVHLVVLVFILLGICIYSCNSIDFFESTRDWIAHYSIIPFITYGLYFGLVTRLEKDPANSLSESSNKARHADHISIKNGTKSTAVSLKEIQYISAAKPYIKIVTGEKSLLYSSSLSAFLSEYGEAYFVRVHKSVIINAKMVTSVSSRKNGDFDLTLLNGDVVRASRNYRDQFQHLL